MFKALLVTFGLSWAAILAFFHFGGEIGTLTFMIFATLLMWVPGTVALVFARKEKLKIPVFSPLSKYYFGAALLACVIAALSVGISLFFGNYVGLASLQENLPSSIGSSTARTLLFFGGISVVVGLSINMVAALGEEIMWRGYLRLKLIHMTRLGRTLFVGSIWGLWHAPLIVMGYNYPGFPLFGVVMMCLLCIAMHPVYEWFFDRGRAVIYPAALHGSINAIAGYTVIVFEMPHPLLVGMAGVAGMAALAIVTLALYPKAIFRR